MTAIGLDLLTIVLAAAGVFGSLLRAITTKGQSFLSRQTVVDVTVGGLVGLLLPAFRLFPADWKIIWQGAAVAIVAYTSSDLLLNVLGHLSSKVKAIGALLPTPTGRRADDDAGGPKP